MEWTFGTLLWSTVVLFFWFAVVWMFIGIFADILRRDMSGWAKAGWIILILFLPFVGILIYVIARPTGYGVRTSGSADEIARAAQLHEDGKITSAEYERLKRHALNY